MIVKNIRGGGRLIIIYCRQVTNNSVIAVQVFDQKKFKKKDQGFLGVINIQVSSVFDIETGGDGICTRKALLRAIFNFDRI